MSTFALPDTLAAAPASTFEFDPDAATEADVLLTAEPVALYRRLLRDQESETVLLAARRILHGFLARPRGGIRRPPPDPDAIADRVGQFREVITSLLEDLWRTMPAAREAVLRQRAPLALLGGCWLDVVSQPATQPSIIVSRLLGQQFVLRGEGNPRRGLHHLRQRALEAEGVYLPEITAADFPRLTEARPLTALHGAFYLSLAKLPANFLPEVIGMHYAVSALGLDDQLLGMRPALTEPELRAVLADYLATAPEQGERVVRAVELATTLELEHAAMLAHLAAWRDGRLREATPNRTGDREAQAWQRALAVKPPPDIVLRPAEAPDHLTFLHRLVNIENYPNTLEMAREHATVVLGIADEVLFEEGGVGVLTDASWFEYTPAALRERVDRICRKATGPGGDTGLGGSATAALAGLTSGACAHRVGTVGRYHRPSDGALYTRYADEMGRGVPGANQVARAYRLLGTMGLRVPHVGDTTFVESDVLPDHLCELAIHELCLSLFPDTFYDEILGFQLGITTTGLACRAAGDIAEAAERSAAVVIGHLDRVSRGCGPDAMRIRWRRIWRGYASFAYFVEPEPLGLVIHPAAEPEHRPVSRSEHCSNRPTDRISLM